MAALADRVRRRGAECGSVAGDLPAHVAGEQVLDERAERHVAQCLRCQAEMARYRRMLRTLHALRDDAEAPPPSVLSGILARLDGGPRGGRVWGPGAWTVVGVATAAGAVGAAGVLVWSSRRRAASA